LDVFSHVVRKAQDIAATISSETTKEQIVANDLTVDQEQASASSNAQITNVNPALMASANEEEKHFVEFEYTDQNGDGVNDVKFEVKFDGGSKVEGTMYGGFHRLDGVPNEGFNLEFVPSEPIEQELKVLRKELRTALDQSLAQARSESKMLSKTWAETSAWVKPIIYVGGAMTGAGQWIGDTVEGVADMAVGIVKAKAATDQWLRSYAVHRQKAFGNFVSGNDEGFKQEMNHIETMHTELGEDISDVGESVRILSLIALDTETRTMLQEFPADYFSELHPTEKVRVGARYGIDFALVFAAGIGAGLLAIKNAGKISGILSRIAKLIEKLKLNLKARKGKVDENYKFKASAESKLSQGAKPGEAKSGLPARKRTTTGWPDLPSRQTKNFETVEPVTLKKGDKIYRIIDDDANPAGGYWSYKLPKSKSEWRSDYAVKERWNDNGKYVEYTVKDKSGLKVWSGKTAGQNLDGTNSHLPGGAEQIWMPAGTVKPSSAKSTNWKD